MECIAIKTAVVKPPQADLWQWLDAVPFSLNEGDVFTISSKVVAIGEGRCLPVSSVDKFALIESEADLVIKRSYASQPLTITNSAFISAAGIDESNGDGYLIMLPKDPFVSAEKIHSYLKKRFSLVQVGVIITDSHSQPLRFGATGISVGFWGIVPLESHIGKIDLFGRMFKRERSNVVDSVASAANVVMGETNEACPLAIVRGVPGLRFVEGDQKDKLYANFNNDSFRVLYDKFLD